MEEAIKDEDLMVVYVEIDPSKEGAETPVIKEEAPDETLPVDQILESAVKHGQFIDIKVHKEDYERYEFLEDIEMEDAQNPDSVRKTVAKRMRRPKINRKDHIPVSYVEQLRVENPKFRRNPSKLIDHLVKLMANLKPPPPPKDFCSITLVPGQDKIIYECKTCGAQCESTGACARHYQYYHGESYLKCFACGLSFTNTPHLYKHEKRCSSADAGAVLRARGRYLGVKGRGRPYTTHNKFQLYAQTHCQAKRTKRRLYCSWCPASFAQRVNLDAHELMHKGLRPYCCDLCPAAYTSDYALRRHLQTHDDYKYICDYCGYACKVKALLVGHMNVHLPHRKHACSHCPKRFSQKPALTHHVNRVHLDLPPAHACPVCAKRYARMSQVKHHMKRTHGLDMITRVMFLHALPRLDPMMVTDAKVVLNNEDDKSTVTNLKPKTKRKSPTTSVPKNNPIIMKNKLKIKIEQNGETISQHVYIPNSDDPDEIKEFLDYLHTQVEPGCKVIKYQDKTQSVSYFRNKPVDTFPKVKLVYD